MANVPYDAWRDFEGPTEDPDPEYPETNEDRYREVLDREAENLPPKEPPAGQATACAACGATFLFDGAEACEDCGAFLHVECRHECERCYGQFCPGCNPSGTCQGCTEVERYREYSAI